MRVRIIFVVVVFRSGSEPGASPSLPLLAWAEEDGGYC
jgi:hypothetical protein